MTRRLDPDIAVRLSSLVDVFERVIDGSSRIVSYGPFPGESREYMTIVLEDDDSFEQICPDALQEAIDWLRTLPKHAPEEHQP